MAEARDFEALIVQVRATHSPIKRMRLLARGWSLLRHLNPLERRRLVARLGVERFEEVLEKLGHGDSGIEPEELDLILDKVGEVEPHKVRELISELKDPERRKEMARRGLEAFKETLRERRRREKAISPEPPAAAPSPAVPPPASKRPAEPVVPPPPAAARPGTPALPGPPAQARVPAPARSVEPPRPKPNTAIAPPVKPQPAPEPRAAVQSRPPATKMIRRPARVERRGVGAARSVVEKIRAAGSLMARFRALRDLLRSGTRPEADDTRALLDLFPEGWARRRALTAMLRAGLPANLEEAIAIIQGLDGELDRRWCAMALVSSRDLDASEKLRVEEAFSSPSLRRRLARRADRR